VLVGLVLAGCATAPPKVTESMKDVEGIDATAREIQVLLYQYASHFASQVDLATSEIYENATDYDTRMAALQWNANAIPEMMKSCFHFDPLAGLLGANAFAVQMDEFFASGNGKDLFGDQQHVAVETSGRLRRELYEMSHRIWPDGDFDTYKQKVIEWAAAHPIENTRFVRGGYDYETALKSGAGGDLGLRLAGSMNDQLLAMTDRANVLMAVMPRQVYWEKEAMLDETQQMVTAMTDSTLAETFGSLGPVMEFLAKQRDLTMRDLARERAAVFEAIADERNAVLMAIADERNETMKAINELSLASLDRLTSSSQAAVGVTVDHVFDRMARLLMIPLIGLGVFLIVVMIWIRSTVNRMLARSEG
jgi:hypothetical protein